MHARLAVAAGIAAFSLLMPGSPAHAAPDPLDVVAATAHTASDKAAADAAFSLYVTGAAIDTGVSGSQSGSVASNVTCGKPVVHATQVLAHTDAVVAETHQTDRVTATATCADATGGGFTASVSVRIEYCAYRISVDRCYMAWTGFAKTVTSSASNGVATPVLDLTAVYSDTHAALGKIRRAYACVRTSRTGTGCVTWDYSGTYGF